jgi:predicted helicase
LDYPKLNSRIRETYAARSNATMFRSLYDNYVRAFRWASDRIKDRGVVAFVSNAGWIEATTTDGMRKCMVDEFTTIDVFHLRGNARTQSEQRRREGDNVFDQGSRAAVAITVLTRNPDRKSTGEIRFHDVGDYLSREQKLTRLRELGSIGGVAAEGAFVAVTPDEHGDWLRQRDGSFDQFIASGSKQGDESAIFSDFSMGVVTARDAWCVNSSRPQMLSNIKRMIGVYESERERYASLGRTFNTAKERDAFVGNFVTSDSKAISWTRSLKADLGRNKPLDMDATHAIRSMYRPFTGQWLYFDRRLNEVVYQMPRLFPREDSANLIICVPARCGESGFSALMADRIVDLNFAPGMGGYQCFPRFVYDEVGGKGSGDLFTSAQNDGPLHNRRDAITDEAVAHFASAYPKEAITKDDLFYYVYGLLHSEEYRKQYADNLSRELPRIPRVKSASDFRRFVEAGRRLGDLHVGFERVELFPVTIQEGDLRLANIPDPEQFYRVEKMKFAGTRPSLDKTTVHYNRSITMTGIPLEAYDYVVNGKPALEWVMERQCVKTDKDSGIVNDANRYAIETVGDPAYPLKLFQRVITVSLETMKIVRALPKLELADA